LCAVLLLTLPLSAYSKDLYRYTNERGILVIHDRITPEYATKGYEIINEKGVVTKVVPRQLTAEELAQRDVKEQMAAAAAAERERLRKWDESLLLRYSTIEDIEAARERALRDLRIRVSILKSNTRTERSIFDREAEIERVKDEFQLDIGRFELLLELVKLRRTLLATER